MTLFPFTPSPAGPFQFQPTLDGNTYNAVVTWNLFGQRYYISLFALDGTLIFNMPLIGSGAALGLAGATWANGIATVSLLPSTARFRVGALVALTVSQVQPDAYNGVFMATVVDNVTFTYPLGSVVDPGPASQLGLASYDINLAGGYFDSTLVYRAPSQSFEVSP